MAGSNALVGVGALLQEPLDHDDDHVISDAMRWIGLGFLALAVPFAVSAGRGC